MNILKALLPDAVRFVHFGDLESEARIKRLWQTSNIGQTLDHDPPELIMHKTNQITFNFKAPTYC